MKNKNTQNLREKTSEELKKMAAEQGQALVFARLQAKSGKSKGGSVARLADELARVLTAIREKELSL